MRKTKTAAVTVTVTLVLMCEHADDAHDALSDVLDGGILQDAINAWHEDDEARDEVRVLSAVAS